MIEMAKRKGTLAELMGLKPQGLKCPVCGGRTWWVIKTTSGDNVIQRRRECRSCGFRKTFFES